VNDLIHEIATDEDANPFIFSTFVWAPEFLAERRRIGSFFIRRSIATSLPEGQRQPLSKSSSGTSRSRAAGTPATTARAVTSRITTAPAATNASSPISILGLITAPPPIRQPRRSTGPRTSVSGRWRSMASSLVVITPGPTKASSSTISEKWCLTDGCSVNVHQMALQGQRILVTGGAGFIGSHLAEALVRAGAEVRVLDNFSSGLKDNLASVSSEIELIEGDVLDQEAVDAAIEGCNLISHQAAQLEIIRCIQDPISDLRSNTEATIRVFEAARRGGVKKVVYASSACVYGQAKTWPEQEDHPKRPNWPYGISKLAAEHYARLYWELHQVSSLGLRYSIVYGPREWYGRALTIFLKKAISGEAPVVFGEGTQQRDLIYVDDVVQANLRALSAPPQGAEALNISTGKGLMISEIADLVCRIERQHSGRSLEAVHEDLPVGGRSDLVDGRQRLPGELEVMILDPARAQRELDWRALVSAEEGIDREREWLESELSRWTEMHY
jgi:nucleoside-diphosphate-sugar epimerase